MVVRMLWNIGSGLMSKALQKNKHPGLVGLHYPAMWRARSGISDCDVNLHLNNSAYIYSMELARWHYTAFSGVLWQALKHRRMFLVASQAIRYRHAIPIFHAYEVKTQMIFWEGPWIYFLHQFQDPSTGKQFAEGLCRVMVWQKGEAVSLDKMISEIYVGSIPPKPAQAPDIVTSFLEWDAASRSSMETAHEVEQQNIGMNPLSSTPETLWGRIWKEMQRSMNRP